MLGITFTVVNNFSDYLIKTIKRGSYTDASFYRIVRSVNFLTSYGIFTANVSLYFLKLSTSIHVLQTLNISVPLMKLKMSWLKNMYCHLFQSCDLLRVITSSNQVVLIKLMLYYTNVS